MDLLRGIGFHIKRIVKSPALIGQMVILPTIVTLFMVFIQLSTTNKNNTTTSSSTPSLAIVLEEGNEEFQKELESLYSKNVFYTDKEQALNELEKGYIRSVYVVPKNFVQSLGNGQKKQMEVYSRQKQKEVLLEQDMQGILQKQLIDTALQKEGILEKGELFKQSENQLVHFEEENATTVSYVLLLLLVMFYILFNVSSISFDLITFKKNYVLKRSLLAPRSNAWITKSFLGAYFVVMFVANLFIIFFMDRVMNVGIPNWFNVCLLVASGIIYSLSLGLFLFRIFKNPMMAQQVGVFGTLFFAGLGMAPKLFQSEIIDIVAHFSPVYWFVQILDRQELLPGLPMVLVMALVFFTAGNYRLETYVD